MAKRIFFSTVFLLLCVYSTQAQIDRNSPLFIELRQQDSIFFERGFNQCDMAYLEQAVADDLKFYHDQSGFQDRKAFLENTRKNICSNPAKKPIRKVDEASLEVFPLYNNGKLYGAIQHGIHHFYIRETGKDDLWTGTARFSSVWLLEKGIWKLSEVLSYDHHEPRPEKQPVNAIEQLLQENRVPAMGLGVIENGKLTKVEVYGTLDGKTKAPYNTIFKVASLTKPIVALTALKLIDKGLLDLDEPLHKYWIDPDLKKDKRYKKLTPRLVLSQQTGFPNWRYTAASNKLAFEFEPGTKYQYSGEGFQYLRKSIEKKLGKSLEELAYEFLFIPAGMDDTRFWWDASMDELRYAQNFNAEGKQLPTTKYYEANAAANLLTTVEDFGKFLAYVLNGAELSQPVLEEMHKNQVQLREDDYFGLGWEKLTGFSNGEYALLHTGKDPGVSALAIIFPKSKNGYLIFLNGDNVDKVYEEMLTKHLYFGKELWEKR
jgi:CubicO group peptidase (beta-lactamase class C family)